MALPPTLADPGPAQAFKVRRADEGIELLRDGLPRAVEVALFEVFAERGDKTEVKVEVVVAQAVQTPAAVFRVALSHGHVSFNQAQVAQGIQIARQVGARHARGGGNLAHLPVAGGDGAQNAQIGLLRPRQRPVFASLRGAERTAFLNGSAGYDTLLTSSRQKGFYHLPEEWSIEARSKSFNPETGRSGRTPG